MYAGVFERQKTTEGLVPGTLVAVHVEWGHWMRKQRVSVSLGLFNTHPLVTRHTASTTTTHPPATKIQNKTR